MKCEPVRVLLVDDSAVARGVIASALQTDPEIRVVGTAIHGHAALRSLHKQAVDVVVLDVEMPVLNGIATLECIRKEFPAVQVIMASALTVDTANPEFQMQTGQDRSRGLELHAIGKITPDTNVVAAYTYTNASVTRSNGTDLGKQIIATPRHQASLWVDYTVPRGALRALTLGAGIHYFGRSYGDSANTIGIPSNTLVDLAVSYDLGARYPGLKGMRVSLAVSNLFDKRYVATCASLSQCYYGTSRVAMATLRYDW